MKQLLSKVVIVLTIALATTLGLWAQSTQTVEYGRTTLQLDPSFTGRASQLGAVLGGVGFSSVEPSGLMMLPVVGGAIDLQTSLGEINTLGGLNIAANGTQLGLQAFVIDTTGSPLVSALLVLNNRMMGRIPLFSLTPPPGTSLPLAMTVGVLQVNGLRVTMHPTGAAMVNNIFHTNAVFAGMTVGTMNVYAVLSPHR
ncbi:MAG: hypothetical protein NVSMB3_11250 [Acidobacteriaceae bacterium]